MNPFQHSRSIQCSCAMAYDHPSGTVTLDQTPRALQTFETACEMMRASVELAPDGHKPAMVVLANESRTDRGARRAFQEVGGPVLACVALVVQSKVAEVTGNFFLRINRPPYPMRLFGDVDEARAWAAEHLGQPLPAEAAALLEANRVS